MLQFKDLDGSGTLTPYEDWRLGAAERARDLGVESLSLHPASSRAPMARATRVRESEWCFIVVIFLVCVGVATLCKSGPSHLPVGCRKLPVGSRIEKCEKGFRVTLGYKSET